MARVVAYLSPLFLVLLLLCTGDHLLPECRRTPDVTLDHLMGLGEKQRRGGFPWVTVMGSTPKQEHQKAQPD